MTQRSVLNLFIGSPSDLAEERRLSRTIVERINRTIGRNLSVLVELRGWEDTLPGNASRSQEKINEDVKSCDIFVGVLYKRWGTPTNLFNSGFEEEYNIAHSGFVAKEIKDIWLFFKEIPKDIIEDIGDQGKRVLEFRQKIEEKQENLYKTFQTADNWKDLFQDVLSEYLTREFATGTVTGLPARAQQQIVHQQETPSNLEANLKGISEVLQQTLDSIGQAHKLENLDSYTKKRIYLLGTALLYNSDLPSETLGVHELQLLYTQKEKLKPLPLETLLILRTILSNSSNTSTGWFWLVDSHEQYENYLEYFATSDFNDNVRSNAMRYLCIKQEESSLDVALGSIDDASDQVKIEALQIVKKYGGEDVISKVKPLVERGSEIISKVAWTTQFSILARTNIAGAVDLLKTTPKEKRGYYHDALESMFNASNQDQANELLSDFDEEVQVRAVRHVAPNLDNSALKVLMKHESAAVRTATVLELLIRGEALTKMDIDMAVSKEIGKSSIDKLFGISMFDGKYEKDNILIEFYKRKSFEELDKAAVWLPIEGHLAYEAMADRYYDSFKDVLRQDILDDFERIRSRYIKSILDLPTEVSSKVLPDIQELDGYRKTLFLKSAMKVLSDHCDDTDVVIARKVLKKELGYLKQDIYRSVLIIVEKHGKKGDLDIVLKLIGSSEYDVQRKATGIALRLTEDKQIIVDLVVGKNEPELVKVLLKYAIDNPKLLSEQEVLELLYNENENIRSHAVAYMITTKSEIELSAALTKYVSKPTYYYNVVCWLDRALYSEKDMRAHFKSSLKDRFQ